MSEASGVKIGMAEIPHGLQVKAHVTVEVKGADKPSLVADALVRLDG